MSEQSDRPSSVYGPVKSWRYGQSLGIDPILQDSICSFDCIYCQLGRIRQVIDEQRVFVPTERIVRDLESIDMSAVDIVTLSGSGEPTLALNIDEIIQEVTARYNKPVLVLTNSTWLYDRATRQRLLGAAVLECKLDAATDKTLERINQPARGVTLTRILDGIRAMRNEKEFRGKLTLQCMLMPVNVRELEELARIIRELKPDEVQVNTPLRPKPRQWYTGARGAHEGGAPVPTASPPTLLEDEIKSAAEIIRGIAGVPVRTVFK